MIDSHHASLAESVGKRLNPKVLCVFPNCVRFIAPGRSYVVRWGVKPAQVGESHAYLLLAP